MVQLTVKTTPVRGWITIFRIAGRYGILKEGPSPQTASRAQPWTWLADFLPIVDERGFTWVPKNKQIQGLVQENSTVKMEYIRADRL